MTCAVCDLAAIRAAHAHAIEWHTFKGETKEVIDAVPSLLDALVAARAREAALTAEVERLATTKADDEQRAANALMVLTVDLGLPMPLADETWVAFAERIRGAVAAVKSDLAAARADAANARQIATEACDGWSAAERGPL